LRLDLIVTAFLRFTLHACNFSLAWAFSKIIDSVAAVKGDRSVQQLEHGAIVHFSTHQPGL